jgi:hypothetical protein
MLSRFFFILLLMVASWSVQASASSNLPLGVVLRPRFFEGLQSFLAQRVNQTPFVYEWGSLKWTGSISMTVGETRWEPMRPGGDLGLAASVKELKLTSTLSTSKGDYQISVDGHPFIAQLVIDLEALYRQSPGRDFAQIDDQDQALQAFAPLVEVIRKSDESHMTSVEKLVALKSLHAFAYDLVRSHLQSELTEWIRSRLDGLVYAESLSRLMQGHPLWREGPILERGGLTLEMDGPPLSERMAIFSISPLAQSAYRVMPTGLEIFADARFLSTLELEEKMGPELSEMSLSQTVGKLRQSLAAPESWREIEFEWPTSQQVDAELTLILPTALINQALQTFYREGLLRFRTTLHLGSQVQGIITPDAPDVSTVVSIHPNTAPTISYEADKTLLRVSNYSLDISTLIEDRLIPSTRIQTSADVFASIVLENREGDTTVNLKVDAETFEMTLTDLTGRMSKQQKDIFMRVARNLWKDFLGSYSNLTLFSSVIQFKEASLEVVGINTTPEAVLLHVNPNYDRKLEEAVQ